jgi:hypothetical protein
MTMPAPCDIHFARVRSAPRFAGARAGPKLQLDQHRALPTTSKFALAYRDS